LLHIHEARKAKETVGCSLRAAARIWIHPVPLVVLDSFSRQYRADAKFRQLPLDLKDIYLKRNPRRTGGKKEISFRDIDPSIHLDKLTSFDPGEPLNARNMFSIGAPPPERSTGAKSAGIGSSGSAVAGSSGNPNLSSAPVRPAGPPPVVSALKFYGTKTDLAEKKRQGFFAEGDEIYVAAEGDLVANRYRVVRIGDSSAEIEEVSSKMRRQISLQ
jgi:hypothetical protein